jgi:hypothetical protein
MVAHLPRSPIEAVLSPLAREITDEVFERLRVSRGRSGDRNDFFRRMS